MPRSLATTLPDVQFVAFTFVAASGLATLEVAANTYIVVLGPPKHAAYRLTFAQSFNGIATVIGPIIAAHTFFNGANATKLDTVQYVYLSLAVFALLLNIGLYFCKLPEVAQGVTDEQEEQMRKEGLKGFLKHYHTIFGFVAEFFYGAWRSCSMMESELTPLQSAHRSRWLRLPSSTSPSSPVLSPLTRQQWHRTSSALARPFSPVR